MAISAYLAAQILLLVRDASRDGRLTAELRDLAPVLADAARDEHLRRLHTTFDQPKQPSTETKTGAEWSSSEMVGIAEASVILGVGEERARQFARSGALPGTRVAGVWIFSRADVTTYRREREEIGCR